MELALGVPLRQWYDDGPEALARLGKRHPQSAVDDPRRSPSYWPLDYPPLSGYQSWLTGLVVRRAEPAAVALGMSSRGHESPVGKAAMRLTVLLCDAAVFFPAAAWMSAVVAARASKSNTNAVRHLTLAVLLLNPALVLIDHGHFQYNCISLGLALGAMAALLQAEAGGEDEEDKDDPDPPLRRRQRPKPTTTTPPLMLPRARLLAAVLFTLSLCHKQMGLYYAPAFFAHILGGCLRDHRRSGPAKQLAAVAAVGVAVVATLAAALLPVVWGHREGVIGGTLAILRRIFPLKRGLYEDYVANFWCATSVGPIKWREMLGGHGSTTAPRAALAATLAALLPSMWQQVASPLPLGFLLCCANSAAAFFLFSFQVHEKSVLLPLMPATLLVVVLAGRQRGGARQRRVLASIAVWGPMVACFGMFPLLERDGVSAAYATCVVAYVTVVGWLLDEAMVGEEQEKEQRGGQAWAIAAATTSISVAGALVLHAARLLFEPPARLPWIHDRLFITYAFLFIASAAAYLNWLQWGRAAWAAIGAGGGGGGRGSRRAVVAARAPRRPQVRGRRGGGSEEEDDDEEETDAARGLGLDAAMPARFKATARQRR